MSLLVEKQRNGPTGEVVLRFRKETLTFTPDDGEIVTTWRGGRDVH